MVILKDEIKNSLDFYAEKARKEKQREEVLQKIYENVRGGWTLTRINGHIDNFLEKHRKVVETFKSNWSDDGIMDFNAATNEEFYPLGRKICEVLCEGLKPDELDVVTEFQGGSTLWIVLENIVHREIICRILALQKGTMKWEWLS